MPDQFQPPMPQPPPSYQQPPMPQQQFIIQSNANLSPTVTMGDWFLFVILQCIPMVNIIMLIVYAFDTTKPSRANFAKLSLILMIISTIISILVIILFFGGIAGLAALSNR